MALDVQRNWDVSMAENLKSFTLRPSSGIPPHRTTEDESYDPPKSDYHRPDTPAYLPDEIVLQILDYVQQSDKAQATLRTCTLLSHQWFHAACPLLYARPYLYGHNFDPFARAICPSKNLHVRRSPLSELVRVLDMGSLVHQASKSTTARLLGRTKQNLETFVAPQSSFAINCLPALAKCRRLRKLDLSLVSEAASLQTLFNTLKGLPELRELRLPRSSGFANHVELDSIVWPPKMESLFLSGGIDAHFLHGVVHLPATLQRLTIEHCPLAKSHAVRQLLETISREHIPLRYLKLAFMPRLSINAFDHVLALLPDLEYLSVSVDYITPLLIDAQFNCFTPNRIRLSTLELTNSGNSGNPGSEDRLSPLDILIAIDDGTLSNLRQVRVAKSLGWQDAPVVEDLDALNDQLRGLGKKGEMFESESLLIEGAMPSVVPETKVPGIGVYTIDG